MIGTHRRGAALPAKETKFGPPNTVMNVAELKTLLVQRTGPDGVVYLVTYVQIGDDLYLPKDSEQWSASLQRLPSSAAQKVLQVKGEIEASLHEQNLKKKAEEEVPSTVGDSGVGILEESEK